MNAQPPVPRLVLVDGSGYIFRAYHAIRPLNRPDGTPVNAVYGFTSMLLKLRETYANDHLVVIFDAARKSFRQEFYPEYKAHRPPAPEDLVPQFPLVREATRALNIPAIELENYEADDLIASYADAGVAQGYPVVIISSDKDLMQLIGAGVSMFDPMKDKPIGEPEVLEKFGVTPDKVIEVQALIGDSSDNVPGVPGIGPKTAAELILQFGDVETLLASLDQIKQEKRRESLRTNAELARISRRLVELKRDVPLPMPMEALHTKPMDVAIRDAFLTAQGFNAILKRLGQSPVASRPVPAASSASPAPSPQLPEPTYETITDEAALQRWIGEAMKAGVIAVDTETTSLNPMQAELVGISLSLAAGKACYIPLGHVTAANTAQSSLFDSGAPKLVEGQLPRMRVLELLAPLLTHPGVLKVGHNIKYDLGVLVKYGVSIAPIGDTMLMSYCVSAGSHGQGLDFLAGHHFGHKMIGYTEVTGSGKSQISFAQVPLDKATAYAAEDADYTLRLYHHLKNQLHAQHVASVYETIERPLIPVIAAMEQAGIRVNPAVLNALSNEFAIKLATLEKEIMALAGYEFLVSSPKQLGEVLFEKMQLPGGSKSSKTGAYSTDADVLEELAEAGHTIAKKVIEWRQFAKLKSTYTDALQEKINKSTGRVHTSFAMAITTTGRLSSSDPNLQNIPIRTEEGRRIRTAFVAADGCKLISADYSQIELRLLAHMANIETLKEAFRNGADIHALTASQMFHVPLTEVTSELRRSAKAINFGIIYGISAHGLATNLGISRSEAGQYIEQYFKQYPGIREYMDTTIEFARQHGYVKTLYGRKIHVKDINAKQPNLRNFSERAAINAPLQGTAADIIKLAMIEVARHQSAKLLLQVHDELVLEAPVAQAEEVAAGVKRIMEQVAHLSVPLTVEVGIGDHWGAIH